jgi:hypothetical protein
LTNFANASYLDTLALAYHMTGQTSEAIETQQKAISLVAEGDTSTRAEMEERLTEYQAALKDLPD